MIQQTDFRRPTPNGIKPTNQTSGGRESWGKWIGRKHYSLEIVQHPIRARMCGFGDKDRRPLAPAAVAKLVVRREDDTIVDVDEIDYTFFPCDGRFVVGGWETRDEPRLAPNVFRPFSSFPSQSAEAAKLQQDKTG
jgi:hypothetical protein